MSTSYLAKDPIVQDRELKVQSLSIPFKVVHNASPASKTLISDEPSLLYIQTLGVSQLPPAVGSLPVPVPSVNPPLGSASTYAILSASAITNTGASVVTGDLGLSPGTSVVGFPPGIVIGTQHITDAAAAAAQVAALATYNYLAALSTTVIPSALDGQTLGPGAYSFGSGAATLAASGNGTLTLNGNSTDVFVIKTATTLGTGAGGIPTITLTGGALASNVFWIVGSSATINIGVTSATSIFVGTVIAQASVTVTQGGTINGRLFALTGAVTLSAATAAINPVVPPFGTASNFDLVVSDVLGTINLLVDVSPGPNRPQSGDRVIKIMHAKVVNRITGVEHPCYMNNVLPALSTDKTQMFLNCNSAVNLATTDLDASLEIQYVTYRAFSFFSLN